MGRPGRVLTPEASALARFGAEVRRWRLLRGLTQAGLARWVWYSAEAVAKVEKAERWPREDFARRCDRVLEAGGALLRLWPDVERERLVGSGRRSPCQPVEKDVPGR